MCSHGDLGKWVVSCLEGLEDSGPAIERVLVEVVEALGALRLGVGVNPHAVIGVCRGARLVLWGTVDQRAEVGEAAKHALGLVEHG